MLNDKENKKYETIEKVINGFMTRKEASIELKLSLKQIDRLIAELRYEGITDIDEANKYLNEVFIPKMNKRFSYAIDKKTSLMRENTYTEEELKLIISERKEKIIDNASCISYNHNYYIPIDLETGEVINFRKGTKCTLIIDYDGEIYRRNTRLLL